AAVMRDRDIAIELIEARNGGDLPDFVQSLKDKREKAKRRLTRMLTQWRRHDFTSKWRPWLAPQQSRKYVPKAAQTPLGGKPERRGERQRKASRAGPRVLRRRPGAGAWRPFLRVIASFPAADQAVPLRARAVPSVVRAGVGGQSRGAAQTTDTSWGHQRLRGGRRAGYAERQPQQAEERAA